MRDAIVTALAVIFLIALIGILAYGFYLCDQSGGVLVRMYVGMTCVYLK